MIIKFPLHKSGKFVNSDFEQRKKGQVQSFNIVMFGPKKEERTVFSFLFSGHASPAVVLSPTNSDQSKEYTLEVALPNK